MGNESNPICVETAREKMLHCCRSTHLEAKIAHLHKFHFIVEIFSPEMLELVQSNVEPRLHVSVEMDDSSVVDLVHANTRVVPKSEDVP